MILQAKNICKSYHNGEKELQILQDMNLEIQSSEILAITGPSGIGKTTLLNVLSTLDKPDSGEVLIQNQDVFRLSDDVLSQFRNKTIGFVFQSHYLLPEFTALENVKIPMMLADENPDFSKSEELLVRVGLQDRLSHRPAALSGGEKQRVAVARALVNSPALVFADEPTGNLDLAAGEKVLDIICQLNEETNASFVIVTHNSAIANRAHRIFEMGGEVQ